MPKKIYSGFVIACLCLISSSAVWAKSGAYINLEASGSTIASSTAINTDLGPGFNVRLGYDWGIVGLRGTFFYAFMENEANHGDATFNTNGTENVTAYGGIVDLKVRPIGFIDIFLQPYVAVGAGAMVLDSDVGFKYYLENNLAPTLHAAVGIDFNITDHFGLVVEGDWKPALFGVDRGGINDSDFKGHWINLVSISGGVRFLF